MRVKLVVSFNIFSEEFAQNPSKIKLSVTKFNGDGNSRYADWSTRDDIKNALDMDLTVLLYQNGYPPEWNEEVFDKVMAQATNYKSHDR